MTISKLMLNCGVAATALLSGTAAWAQAADGKPQEVVITGSRLTTGFQTPTPVTAVTADNLAVAAPNNVADALQQLPALSATLLSSTPQTGAQGNNGQSLLNLRGLGDSRNLVLLDGHRVVASNTDNSVDVNTLPQNLLAHVDVVTGGASAAYGSDAVAGVVNFVLDTKYKGFKGDVGAGISGYDDMASRKFSFAWGNSFLDDRLHVIASVQYAQQDGVGANQDTHRSWWQNPAGLIPNSFSSQPTNLVVPNIRSSIGTYGGLITAGALKGTQFLAGGTPAPFNYGYDSGASFQSGGDGASVNFGFTPNQWRTAEFGHAEYDLNNDNTIYGEASFAYSSTKDDNEVIPETGSQFAFTIFSGNPFIPAATQAAMTANKLASFSLGRYLAEWPVVGIDDYTRVNRELVGIKGANVFGLQSWHYDVSFESGQTYQYLPETNLPIARNIYAAADAVVNPQTGATVCRSQYYNAAGVFVPGGTGEDPGCQPLNLFGVGSAAQSAIAQTIGTSWKKLQLDQNVGQASLSGDFGDHLQFGAGPISFATGLEYRTESADQTTDALSPTINDFTGIRGGPASLAGKLGPFRLYNPLPFSGSYNVKEGFFELGVPILKDLPFVRSLNADLAVRNTDYSLSGDVTTWKYGLDWQVIDDLRIRGTVSQDIRAPNLLELFNTATQNSLSRLYPSSTTGVSTQDLEIRTGNPNLKPEQAETQTFGAVFTPRFVPGFSFSADYYKIRINGAIANLGSQNEIDFCFQGQQQYCKLLSFNAGILVVQLPTLNLNVMETDGWDFEGSYRTQLFGNSLQLHLYANNITANYTQAPSAPVLSTLGQATSPTWRFTAQAHYTVQNWSLFVQERYIAASLMDATQQQGIYTNNNQVPQIFYTDMTLTYDFHALGSTNQLYFTVNNLLNQSPPVDVGQPSTFSQPTNRNVYDYIGRYFNVGMRFKF